MFISDDVADADSLPEENKDGGGYNGSGDSG